MTGTERTFVGIDLGKEEELQTLTQHQRRARIDIRAYFNAAYVMRQRPQQRPAGIKKWEAMQQNKPGAGRFIHISCMAGMVPNPKDELAPHIPFVQRPGKTYRKAA